MKPVNRVTDVETEDSRWNWLYKASGAAALILGLLFLAASISLIAAYLQPGTINNWLLLFQNNWLVVLFKLNAKFDGVQFDRLYGLNPLDIAILVLVAILFLGLFVTLRRTSRIWSFVALVMPILGIIVFTATKLAGRSGVMTAVLVISLVMLKSNNFGRLTAILGILASLLLLVGDFGTTANSHSTIVAILVGIGYVFLMTWFFLAGRSLFRLRQS
jgi:hypothetical protein